MRKFCEDYLFFILFVVMIFIACYAVDSFPSQMIDRAKPYLPKLSAILNDHWSNATYKYFIAGQIEKESNFKEMAELKTSREIGTGLSQITVTPRYNNFLEATKRWKELSGWTWGDRFNVDYQLHFIVLQDKSNFSANKKLFSDDINRWAGALVSYNAGYGTVLQRRSLCKVTEGCDFNLWFGGLDQVQLKTERGTLYSRSLWGMRNNYPSDIIFNRSGKYKCLLS